MNLENCNDASSFQQRLAIQIAGFSIIFLTQAAISIYLPSFLSLQHYFSTTKSFTTFSLTVYLCSFALCMFIGSELSEYIGRKKVLVIGTSAFALCSFLISLSSSTHLFIVFRILEGACAGLMVNSIRASAGEVFEGRALVKTSAYFSMAVALAAGIPQFFGDMIEKYLRWQWDFYALSLLSLIIFIYVLYQFPETKKTIKQQRSIFIVSKDYWQLFSSATFYLPTFLSGLIFGITISFNVISPYIFQEKLHFSSEKYGFISLFITVGYLLGAFLTNRLVAVLSMRTILNIGLCIILMAALSMLTWNYFAELNAYSVCIPMFFAITGQAMLLPVSLASVYQSARHKSGNIAALYGSTLLIMSSALTFLISFLPSHGAVSLSLILLGITVFAILIRSYSAVAFFK